MKAWIQGVELNAEFGVVDDNGELRVAFESRGGSGEKEKNPDYAKTQELVLSRLASLDAFITDASIESTQALKKFKSRSDRRLHLTRLGESGVVSYPIRVSDWDADELRLALGRAQSTTARSGRGNSSRGNGTKRVALSVKLNPSLSASVLEGLLATDTPLVVLQPAADKASARNWKLNMEERVPVSRAAKHLEPADVEVLKGLYPSGDLQLWGTRVGNRQATLPKWERLQLGDKVFFYGGKRTGQTIFAGATIVHTVRSKSLAKDLWGSHADGTFFELIYFVDEVKECGIPLKEANMALGYAPNNVIQGFTILNAEVGAAFLKRFDPGTTRAKRVATVADKRRITAAKLKQDLETRRRQVEKLLDDKTTDKRSESNNRVEQRLLRQTMINDRQSAPCALCGRDFDVMFLHCAHIKPRSRCNVNERLDLENIAMLACRFGCDDLYERGLVTVSSSGEVRVSPDLASHPEANKYAGNHLIGKTCSAWKPENDRYFKWHRENDAD